MSQAKLAKALSVLTLIILVLVPFQALITTWPGSVFGHLDVFRIWKELLLVPLTIGALMLIYKDKKQFIKLFTDRLIYLILFYAGLQIALGVSAYLSHKVSRTALIYGLLINLRFFVFFVDCMIIGSFSKWLSQHWRQILLMPAALVIGFGLLQHFILNKDFLRHFGYGPKTIPAYQAVDQKPQYIRLQSTLRGPNPLGAYLALVTTALIAWLVKRKNELKSATVLLLATGGIVLFFTYSRSAWLGTTVSLVVVAFLGFPRRIWKNHMIWLLVTVLLIGGGLAISFRHNSVFENTFFHTDQTSRSLESTNTVHTQALTSGLRSVANEPFGRGPGTAGPASFRNSLDQPRIAENYFIQVAQEVGIAGLIVFLLINLLVAARLWQQRSDLLSMLLLASLVGLTFINLLSHAWADDTLAYIWWGLAGLALSDAILNKKRKQYAQKTKAGN